MSDEWGVFTDEGCVAAGFWSQTEAEAHMAEEDSPELRVARICPDHEEQDAEHCEDCDAAEEEEDEES